jgi:hypothetical protein
MRRVVFFSSFALVSTVSAPAFAGPGYEDEGVLPLIIFMAIVCAPFVLIALNEKRKERKARREAMRKRLER